MEEARAEEARRLEEHTLAAFRRRLRDELAPRWCVWLLGLALGGAPDLSRAAADAAAAAGAPVSSYPNGPMLRALGAATRSQPRLRHRRAPEGEQSRAQRQYTGHSRRSAMSRSCVCCAKPACTWWCGG